MTEAEFSKLAPGQVVREDIFGHHESIVHMLVREACAGRTSYIVGIVLYCAGNISDTISIGTTWHIPILHAEHVELIG